MKLDMQVDLGPRHIVLDEDPAPPPPKGHSLQFSAHIRCGQVAAYQDSTWYGGRPRPGATVLDGDPAPLPKKGAEPPNFQPMFIVAKRLDGSRWYLAWT